MRFNSGKWKLEQSRLPSKFRSEKIPRNKFGTVFVIPRKKIAHFADSACLGIEHSEVRNGTEFREKMKFGGTSNRTKKTLIS